MWVAVEARHRFEKGPKKGPYGHSPAIVNAKNP